MAKIRKIIGAGCVLIAVLANPWFIARFVVLDGHLEQPGRVLAVDAALLIVGMLLIFWRSKPTASEPTQRGRETLFAAIALALASLFAVGAVELVLRVVVSPFTVLHGDLWQEARWRLEQEGRGSNDQVEYAFDQYDSRLGWVPKPSYDHEGIRTNSLGIRADREYSFTPPEGVSRIVAVGDSFTWGENTWSEVISNEETFTAIMERKRERTEVLNLGVHGWGTDQQYLYLKDFGLRFQPDVVLLGFYEGDMQRNGMKFFSFAKPYFELTNGSLELQGVPVPSLEEVRSRPLSMPSFFLGSLVRKNLDYVLDRTKARPIETRRDWQLTRAVFEAARRDAENAGASFVLIYIPFDVGEHPSAIECAVVDWAREAGAHLINMREEFATHPATKWGTFYDGHWTKRGHEEVANTVNAYLSEHELLR